MFDRTKYGRILGNRNASIDYSVESSIPITYIHSKSHKMRKVNRMRAKIYVDGHIFLHSLFSFLSVALTIASVMPSRLPVPAVSNRK